MAYTLPKNYDEISDEKGSNIRIIGAHELTIVSITEYKTKEGEESLKVDFDTADGLFSNKYYSSGRKWPNEGTKYLSFKEENLNYFKAFVKDLETSNDVKLNLTGGEEIAYNDVSQSMGLFQNKDISKTVLIVLVSEIILLVIFMTIYIMRSKKTEQLA